MGTAPLFEVGVGKLEKNAPPMLSSMTMEPGSMLSAQLANPATIETVEVEFASAAMPALNHEVNSLAGKALLKSGW